MNLPIKTASIIRHLIYISFFIFFFNHTITSQTNQVIVDDIIISGNKRTKDFIILRELDFQINDTISLTDSSTFIEINENKIFNTELFLSVEIALISSTNNHTKILIVLSERWYIFPSPIIALADRNVAEWGQESNYSLSRLDWGGKFEHSNFRGRKENLQLSLEYGFTNKHELFHVIPYINKEKTLGLNYGISYATNKNVSYLANIDNKRLFLESDKTLRKKFRIGASTVYRKKFYAMHQVGTAYHNNKISDQLLALNPNYLGENKVNQQFFRLFYEYDLNKTNINYYPTKGFCFNTIISQNGIGIFDDINLTEITSHVDIYKELNPILTLASRISIKASSGESQPYLQQKGFGYAEDFVRGFESYVIDAQHYALNRTELKLKIISYTTNLSKVMKAEEFHKIPNTIYFNIFNDTGYSQNDDPTTTSPLANTWLNGYGIGIDFVSFYDIVLRCEYSFASNGTNGLFLHFGKSI